MDSFPWGVAILLGFGIFGTCCFIAYILMLAHYENKQ